MLAVKDLSKAKINRLSSSKIRILLINVGNSIKTRLLGRLHYESPNDAVQLLELNINHRCCLEAREKEGCLNQQDGCDV